MKNFFPNRAVSCPVLFCCSFNLEVKTYNKSFIDQACSVKMAGYWPLSFFAFYGPKNAKKKELGQYPAILTSRLVNNAYLCGTVLTYYAAKLELPANLHIFVYIVFIACHGVVCKILL